MELGAINQNEPRKALTYWSVGHNPVCAGAACASNPRDQRATPKTGLYDPASQKQFGIVLATEPAYEFEDEEIKLGVLIKAENGVERWVPRANMSKVFVPAD